nr:DctP family TRAP transporter solute-binding subunit [Ammoniphilus resinae]
MVGCSSSTGTEQSNSDGGATPENSNGESYTISVAHVLSETHSLHKTWQKFKEVVEADSGGKLKVEIYANGEKGSDRELIESVQVGTLTATAPSTAPVAGFDPAFSVFDLPFLFKDRETAYRVLDGEVGKEVLSKLDNIGIKGLGYWENGYRNLTNNKIPVKTPADVKSLKIRTMENPMHAATWELLGGNPTPMAWADVYVSLQQGALDGQENPLSIIYDQKIYEVNKYVSLTGHVYSPFVVMINKKFYDELPEDLKAIVDKGFEEAKNENRKLVVEEENKIKSDLANTPMEVIELTADEKKAFQEFTKPVYDQFADEIGKDLVDKMLKAIE